MIRLILTYLIIRVLIPFFSFNMEKCEVSSNTIHFTYNHYGHMLVQVDKDSSYFLFDTGCATSVIFKDRMKIPSKLRYFLLVNNKQPAFVRKVDSICLGVIKVRNKNFTFMKASNTIFRDDTKILGIIGMDILSKKYCFFDNKKKTLILSDEKMLTPKAKADLVLPYKMNSFERIPYVDLCMREELVENVIFDTGFNGFLSLRENDLSKDDSMRTIPYSQTDYLGKENSALQLKIDSISINNIRFTTDYMVYSQNIRLLGTQFVSCFSSYLIDPFSQTIEFYI